MGCTNGKEHGTSRHEAIHPPCHFNVPLYEETVSPSLLFFIAEGSKLFEVCLEIGFDHLFNRSFHHYIRLQNPVRCQLFSKFIKYTKLITHIFNTSCPLRLS